MHILTVPWLGRGDFLVRAEASQAAHPVLLLLAYLLFPSFFGSLWHELPPHPPVSGLPPEAQAQSTWLHLLTPATSHTYLDLANLHTFR